MNTFDSTKSPLNDLLQEIITGHLQLPDFQRGWVWDDFHIRDLLVSVARSFPIGSVMLLESGGDVRFETRPIEGLEDTPAASGQPERLILDGQQRLTTLTQALRIDGPVQTRTEKGRNIERYYYFDIRAALDSPEELEEAIVAVDANRQIRDNFGKDLRLDLSTTELECEHMHFPCNRAMNSDSWEETLLRVQPDQIQRYFDFRARILGAFRNYQIPVILLKKETPKEAVCLVFEKVNTGGVSLSVFELITASFAADGFNLRDDWYGSEERSVEGRRNRLCRDPLLDGTEATEFLQAISLLHTHDRREQDRAAGRAGRQVRPISAKRAEVLNLPLDAWNRWADPVEAGFRDVARFLKRECVYKRRELPYSTQLVPLAAVMTRIGDRWQEPRIYDKLARWYWCGVLGELYGGAVETRMANDYDELIRWFEDDEITPRTVRDANFQADRLDSLKSRLSAAYKGIHLLVLRSGSQDWFWKASVQGLDADDISLDIHHIFPRKWCDDTGIDRSRSDSILNKTSISYKANRKIGARAPSEYLERLQSEPQVRLDEAEMDALVESHALSAALLRADDFDAFIEDRRERLCRLVEAAMGKASPTH